MQLSELCRRTGTTKKEIKYYESLELISSVRKKIGSKIILEFDEEIVNTIKELKKINSCSFDIIESRKILDELDSSQLSNNERIALLKDKIKKIDRKIAELKNYKNEIIKKTIR